MTASCGVLCIQRTPLQATLFFSRWTASHNRGVSRSHEPWWLEQCSSTCPMLTGESDRLWIQAELSAEIATARAPCKPPGPTGAGGLIP